LKKANTSVAFFLFPLEVQHSSHGIVRWYACVGTGIENPVATWSVFAKSGTKENQQNRFCLVLPV
jgi:hypothetical protein